jgi:hypothetical protein
VQFCHGGIRRGVELGYRRLQFRRIPDLVERSAAAQQMQNECAFVAIRALGPIDLAENPQFFRRDLERSISAALVFCSPISSFRSRTC